MAVHGMVKVRPSKIVVMTVGECRKLLELVDRD